MWKKGCSEYSVWLRRSKCNLAGDGEWVTCRGYGVVSSVTLLRRYMEEMGLLREPDALLFPTRRGRQWRKSSIILASWLRETIKALAESLGLDKRYYSTHSLRAGGATDLFVARVPYFAIKKMGRWKSDSAMLYYRCEEDVCKAVAEAFSEVSEFY